MVNEIRTGDPRGFNKGRSSKFREGSRVQQTPEEGRRTYRPKRYGNSNKDEENRKSLMIKINKLHLRNLDNYLFSLVYLFLKSIFCREQHNISFC